MKVLNNWNCTKCKQYNDILNLACWNCKQDKPEWVTTFYQIRVEFQRGIFYGRGFGDIMTDQEKLFRDFYNREKIFVKDMDIVQLREHREKLSKIAFEAKARLRAVDDENQERGSKTKNKEWLTTVDTNQNVSDAINVVKTRQARLSQMDKLKKQLEAAGIDDDTIKEMIRNMERKATESGVKAITFAKPKAPVEIAIEEAKIEGVIPDNSGKPNPFAKFVKKVEDSNPDKKDED